MTKEHDIKAIIWDMGGVLLRTVDVEPRQRLAQRFDLSYHELMDLVFYSETAIKAEIGQISFEEHWGGILDKLGLSTKELPWFMDVFFQGDKFDEDLILTIRSLRPKYLTGLLSNALPKARSMLGTMYDFLDEFDDTIFSSEVGMRKPDPRIYELALKRLEVAAPESVFIDDMPENVAAAQNAKMFAILFKNPAQVKTELQCILDGKRPE